ncbi:unnamed protein product [Alternaria alternata]|jgi:hypothetical protein
MFVYEPIDLDRPAFRVLHLLSGKWSTIECTMYQANLDGADTIPYEALSYTWGGTDKNFTVTVNGEYLDVTKNLYLALQHLRSDSIDRVLWIDAICIDQSNEIERGHQVQQMCKIYSQAEEVVVWLGQATRETDDLMGSLQRLEELSSPYAYGHSHWNLPQWTESWLSVPKNSDLKLRKGLNQLLSRPWFKRVWILQEVANARKASILCGTKSVRAHTFALAPLLMGIKPDRHCQAVLDIMPGRLREDTWWTENRDLYNLLLKFSESEASDPRDKVYALLGLCSDAWDTNSLRPDYKKGVQKVIHDTSSFLFGPSNVSYETMADFLLNLTSRSVASFVDLAKMSDVSEVDHFLKRRGLEVPLSEDMIRAAAANERNGREIMILLLQERGEEFILTKGVIEAAAGNEGNWQDVMTLLLGEHGRKSMVTSSVIEVAAKNEKNGLEIIEFFHEEREHKWWITDGVVEAAAANENYGMEIMNILHRQHEKEFRITKRVIEAARENTRSGGDIMNFLFRECRDGLESIIVNEFGEALEHDEGVRGLLHGYTSFWRLNRTLRKIVHKASLQQIRMAIKMLLYPLANVNVEGGMHRTAPKAAPAKRHEAVLRLLLEPSAPFIAHRSSDPFSSI